MEQTLIRIQHRALDQCLDYLSMVFWWHEQYQNPDAQVQDVVIEVFEALGYAEEEIPQQVRKWNWDELFRLIDRLEDAVVDELCRVASCLGDKEALVALAKAFPHTNTYKRCEKIKTTMKKIAVEYIANLVRSYVQVPPYYSPDCSPDYPAIYFTLEQGGYIRIADSPSRWVAETLSHFPLLEITVGSKPHWYTDIYLPIPFNHHAIDEIEEELNRELTKYAVRPEEIWYEEKLT